DLAGPGEQPLVMVDHGHGQGLLDPLLADDVRVEVGDELARGGQVAVECVFLLVLGEDGIAGGDALAADVRGHAPDAGGHQCIPFDQGAALRRRAAAVVADRGGCRCSCLCLSLSLPGPLVLAAVVLTHGTLSTRSRGAGTRFAGRRWRIPASKIYG